MEKNLQRLECYRISHAQEWDFKESNLSIDELKAICEALKEDKLVHKVNLKKNKAVDSGVKWIAEVLKVTTSLQTFDLSWNKIDAEGAKLLAEALKVNTSIHHFSLYSNKFGDTGVKWFAEALKVNTSLQTLWLSENNVGAAGAMLLAEALKVNTSFRSLHLDRNKIDAAGAMLLAEVIKANTSLRTLNLYKNNVGDEGAKLLAEMVKVNTSLRTLNLGKNNVGDEGAKLLAEMVKVNTSLQTLHLSDNNIGYEGAKLLAEMVKVNTSLQNLHLSGVDPFVKQMIQEALSRNKQLKDHGLSLPSPSQGAPSQGTPSGGTTSGSRHEAGFVPGPANYVPISNFVKGFAPLKPCSQYICEDCHAAFEERDAGSGQYFPTLVEEATKVTASRLQSYPPPGGSASNAFAIVCYTMELSHFGASEKQNFFQILNKSLQERNPSFLTKIQGYLFYLMSGLQGLPTLAGDEAHTTYYRGLPASCLATLVKHYTRGRHIHWSGLTSVSRNIETSQSFAGKGGCIIQVDAFSARDISQLSAFPEEAEALLLPNFHAIVMKAPFKDEQTGYWHMEILEQQEETFVF